jgi:hypothetical protein
MVVKNNYIFFTRYDDKSYNIYRMNIDGTNAIKLNSTTQSSNYLAVEDQYIYFKPAATGLSRMNYDGSNVIQISAKAP